MPAFISLAGQRFGRLVVIERAPNSTDVQHPTQWLCRCDCGNQAVVKSRLLRVGDTRSCGCLHREQFRALVTVHGHTRVGQSREYSAWQNAKRRCFDSTNDRYQRYGGRGITMCAAWREDFAAFLAHIGPCPTGLTLDRIHNDGHYEPGNVRWATREQQARNKSPRSASPSDAAEGATV